MFYFVCPEVVNFKWLNGPVKHKNYPFDTLCSKRSRVNKLIQLPTPLIWLPQPTFKWTEWCEVKSWLTQELSSLQRASTCPAGSSWWQLSSFFPNHWKLLENHLPAGKGLRIKLTSIQTPNEQKPTHEKVENVEAAQRCRHFPLCQRSAFAKLFQAKHGNTYCDVNTTTGHKFENHVPHYFLRFEHLCQHT